MCLYVLLEFYLAFMSTNVMYGWVGTASNPAVPLSPPFSVQTWNLQSFGHGRLLHQMSPAQLLPAGTSRGVRLRERFPPRWDRPTLHGLHTWVTQTLVHFICYQRVHTIWSCYTVYPLCSHFYVMKCKLIKNSMFGLYSNLISLQCIPVRICIYWFFYL